MERDERTAPQIYVEVRLYRWDPQVDPPLPGGASILASSSKNIDSTAVRFHNLPNAAAVFEDLATALGDAYRAGTADARERIKPGPRRGRRTVEEVREAGLHELESVGTPIENAALHELGIGRGGAVEH